MIEDVEELRNALKSALNEIAAPMESIPFTRENYNRLFPESRIKTPLEEVKLGEHQFEKLDVKERQNILQAVHDALCKPDIVIDEKRQSVFGDINTSHVYAKAFEINGKNKAVQSVVVVIENENVSISTHERGINNVVNKIKMPDQLIYASAEIGQVVERLAGQQFMTVNPTRVNGYAAPPASILPQHPEKSSGGREPQTIIVNGKPRNLSNGLEEGFINAVKQVDELLESGKKLLGEYSKLKQENAELKRQIERRNKKSREIER